MKAEFSFYQRVKQQHIEEYRLFGKLTKNPWTS